MSLDSDELNMANKIMAEFESHDKKVRGFPTALKDGRLLTVRQHLRFLLETTWDEVGWRLPKVRTMSQLRSAIRPWEKRFEQEEHVVKALLRLSESRASSRLLYRQRKQVGQIHARFLDAHEWIGKRWDSLEKFLAIQTVDMSAAEQDVIRDAIYERARLLAHAGHECISLRDQEKELDELIKDGEAYFARYEFLRFCREKRYRLTPLDIANALAGLPFIGYRHSIRRCRKWPEESGGLSYGIFQILKGIVASNARRSELIRDTENWLHRRHPARGYAVTDLRQHWYYLRRAISDVLARDTRRAELAPAISREYWKRKSTQTAIDRAFADDEQITV